MSDDAGFFAVSGFQGLLEDNFAPWVRALGLTVASVDREHLCLRVAASDATIRTGGIISGQAMMAAADTAMALAAIAATGEFQPAATVDMTTSFVRPAGRGELQVDARVVKAGRRMIFTRCEITAIETGKLVATATGTFALP